MMCEREETSRTAFPLGMWWRYGMGTPQTRWREMHHSERERTKDSRRFRAVGCLFRSAGLVGRTVLTYGRVERYIFEGVDGVIFESVEVGEPLGSRPIHTIADVKISKLI